MPTADDDAVINIPHDDGQLTVEVKVAGKTSNLYILKIVVIVIGVVNPSLRSIHCDSHHIF